MKEITIEDLKAGMKVRLRDDLVMRQVYDVLEWTSTMDKFKGKAVTLKKKPIFNDGYLIEEDGIGNIYTPEMIAEIITPNTLPDEYKFTIEGTGYTYEDVMRRIEELGLSRWGGFDKKWGNGFRFDGNDIYQTVNSDDYKEYKQPEIPASQFFGETKKETMNEIKLPFKVWVGDLDEETKKRVYEKCLEHSTRGLSGNLNQYCTFYVDGGTMAHMNNGDKNYFKKKNKNYKEYTPSQLLNETYQVTEIHEPEFSVGGEYYLVLDRVKRPDVFRKLESLGYVLGRTHKVNIDAVAGGIFLGYYPNNNRKNICYFESINDVPSRFKKVSIESILNYKKGLQSPPTDTVVEVYSPKVKSKIDYTSGIQNGVTNYKFISKLKSKINYGNIN